MKITLMVKNAIQGIIITDEHSASSYGIPVAVVDGQAYGPDDELPIWPDDELSFLHERAATTIAAAVISGNLSPEEKEFVRKFYL